MYIKSIALLCGAVLSQDEAQITDTSTDSRFQVLGVFCDGNGLMAVDYHFHNSENTAEEMNEFQCEDYLASAEDAEEIPTAMAEGATARFLFNPYACKDGSTPNGLSMSSFNFDGSFTVHAAVDVGRMLNLRQYTMEVSCTFLNEYKLTTDPETGKAQTYEVEEDDQRVKFTTFEMSEGDFTMSLSAPSDGGDEFTANEKLTATIAADMTDGSNWSKLNSAINFAPTECSVSQSGVDDFALISAANPCGFTQLLMKMREDDDGRTWEIDYQTFVMSDSDAQYTLKCTLTMCTQQLRDKVEGACASSCCEAYECTKTQTAA
jgi:hypothetical protein